MKLKIKILSLFTFLSFFLPSTIQAETILYKEGSTQLEGLWFAAESSKAPGIVLIHNWMGVSEESVTQAKRFQALGYSVLVADIYGQGVRPKNQEEAGKTATIYKSDRKLFRKRIEAAVKTLRKQKNVDSKNIAVLGYCFGGTGALEAARHGLDIKGAISFHGGLDSPTSKDGKKIRSKILALHGAADPFVSLDDLRAFEKEMSDHKVDYELVNYGGVVHSFTDKGAGLDVSKGAAYNAQADVRSFERAKNFLAEVFGTR